MNIKGIPAKEEADMHRMERELDRIRPIVAELNDRLRGKLEASGRTICSVFGVMDGDTKTSAFIAVTEPCVVRGIQMERFILETHRAALVLDFFEEEERQWLESLPHPRCSPGIW